MKIDFEDIARIAAEKAEGIEYKTFSISLRLPESAIKEEENTFKKDGLLGRTALKTRISRELRDLISKRNGKLFEVDGEVNFRINLEKKDVGVEIKPIFLLCKYRKLKRGISQTRWDKYDSSVEGYVVKAAGELYHSTNAFLHGAGREDVDVRMLGDGRICTVEIVGPKKRTVAHDELERKVREVSGGDIELDVLREVTRDYVWIVKEAHFDKVYDAEVKFEKEIGQEQVDRVTAIRKIEQLTPTRVMHRRADLVRHKNVLGIWLIEKHGNSAKFRIKTEAGTYIKELISGDSGRTRPSFAETAGCNASCTALDVVKVHEYVSDWW
ncbi:MAG: tRNA pseudouridine(54/55) synthase Pus10 [Candidatus Micrarchaeia archaeon]